MAIEAEASPSDSSPWPPPRGRERARLWLRSGRELKSWFHGLLAFAVGPALASRLEGGVAVSAMLGPLGLLSAIALVAVAAVVFGFLGQMFLGKPDGWQMGWTALVYVPFVLAALYTIPDPYDSNENDLLRYSLSGAVAAACALVTHAGPARLAGWLLVVLVFVALAAAAA